MILSILTPAVPSRWAQLQRLSDEVTRQIGGHQVEHLILMDNKKRTVGEKRDALLRAARGQYISFVDDDDWISPDYVEAITGAIHTDSPDVITFCQRATCNGQTGEIVFGLGNPNEEFKPCARAKRNAWHVCAWRRQLAILSHFPATNYGEDWAFAAPLCGIAGLKELHIPRILHHYRHDIKTTEAPPP